MDDVKHKKTRIIELVGVNSRKRAAEVYIDDKAVCIEYGKGKGNV